MFRDDAVGIHFGASRLCVCVSSCSDTHLGSSYGVIMMKRAHANVNMGTFLSLLRIEKEDDLLFLKGKKSNKKKKIAG